MKAITEQLFITKVYNVVVNDTLLPLLIMTTTPNFILLLTYIIIAQNSDLKQCLLSDTLKTTLNNAWNAVDWYENNIFLIKMILKWETN